MRKLRKRLKRRNRTEGDQSLKGVSSTPPGTNEYLAGHILGVSLTRDFYLIRCIDNEKLESELRTRYDRNDCELMKRERIYEDLIEKVNALWKACKDVKDMVDVQNYLTKVIKLFDDNYSHYLIAADRYKKDEFVSSIFLALAENENSSARMIRDKFIPYALV
jgi:hypothetical protein